MLAYLDYFKGGYSARSTTSWANRILRHGLQPLFVITRGTHFAGPSW